MGPFARAGETLVAPGQAAAPPAMPPTVPLTALAVPPAGPPIL